MSMSSVYRKLRIVSIFATLSTLFLFPHIAHAENGTWNGTQDNMWTNSANWSSASYPSGGESATFDNDGNSNTAISIAGLVEILNITFTNPSVASYTIGTSGQKVRLQTDAYIHLTADAANSQTIQSDLELPFGNSPVTFRNDNSAQTLTLGKMYGYEAAGATKSVYAQGAGPIIIQSDLDRINSYLNLYHQSTDTLTLKGISNITQLNIESTGTLKLNGNGSMTATACEISGGGTLLLENTATANNTDRLNDATPVTLEDGTLAFTHDAGNADFSETTGAVTIGGGSNTIAITQAAAGHTCVLTLTSFSRSSGTVDFVGSGLGESVSNRIVITGQAAGIIGSWATVNGSGIAAYDPVLGVYDITSAGSTSIAARGPDSVIPDNASIGALIDSPGSSGPITLAGEWTNSIFYVYQKTTTPAEITTVNGVTNKTLLTSSLLIPSGGADLTVGSAVDDGYLAPLSSGGSLTLNNDDASASLIVNADLVDNGSASSLEINGPGDIILNGEVNHTGATTVNTGSLTFGGHEIFQQVNSIIGGSGGITKSGTNLLYLTTANTYTGSTYINEGTLRVRLSGALGTSAGGTVIADGATLDLGGGTGNNSFSFQSEPITVSGTGTDGQGAIVNISSYYQWNATGKVTLDDDTTFGGPGRWDIRGGTFTMNDHSLTKVSDSWFALSSTAVYPGGDNASIDVQSGTLRAQRAANFNGSAANTIHLRYGTTLNFYDIYSGPKWTLIFDSNTTYRVEYSSGPTHNTCYGPVILNGPLSLTSGSSSFVATFAGDVSGSGSLVKKDGHTFSLTGTNNTYSGTTTVNSGTLYASDPGSIPGHAVSGNISVAAGAMLHIPSDDGTSGFSGGDIQKLNTNAVFLSESAMLGIDTSPADLDIPENLPGFMGLTKLGTNTLSLSGSATNIGNIVVNQGQLTVNSTLSQEDGDITMNDGILTANGTVNQGTGDVFMNDGLLTVNGTLEQTTGRISLRKGELNINGTVNQGPGTCYLEADSGGDPILRMTSGNFYGTGDFSIRNNGAFYMEGGTLNRPTSTGFGERFALGYNDGGYGYMKMSGGTISSVRFILGRAADATAGHGGMGIARISGGTASFSYLPHFGCSPASIGILTIDSSGTFLKTGGEIYVAYQGGRCEMNLTGGTFNNNGNNFRVGEGSYNSATGIVNLCAGRFENTQLNRYSGVFLINFCGGTFSAGDNTPTEMLGSSLTGVYSYGPVSGFNGGACFDTHGRSLTLSTPVQAPAGQGVQSISLSAQGSGYIGEPYVEIRGGGGNGATAVANMADDGSGEGTFKVASVTITCPGSGYTSAPVVTFLKGGADVITATGTAALAANIGGGLTKLGEGTLSLAAANTYGGTTTVSNGILRIAVQEALPSNTDIHVGNGTLDLGGFLCTNGAVTATAGTIANGTLVADSFTKTGDGSVTLATPLVTDEPIIIESGTLSLVPAAPGLYEGPLGGSFNTTDDMSTNILVQLTTRMANTNAKPPWTDQITYLYKGYIWNRETTNVTWTFAESIDDYTLLKIDGVTLLNDGSWSTPTIANHTLTPGAHSFEARFGNGSGGAGRVYTAWWQTSAFGFGVDYAGRNETNIANYVSLTDPGNGSLLTAGLSSSNQISTTASVILGNSGVLNLAGTLQTLESVNGSGTVSNGTLAVTGDIIPGGEGSIGTLTLDSCNLAGGNLLLDVATNGDSDCLAINGDIDLSNLTLEIANGEELSYGNVYKILTCNGTRTGKFSAVNVPDPRWHPVYRPDGSVDLLFLGGTVIIVL